ncbi:hypothetical protein D3C81_1971310 [compost metagenome]
MNKHIQFRQLDKFTAKNTLAAQQIRTYPTINRNVNRKVLALKNNIARMAPHRATTANNKSTIPALLDPA